MGWLFFCFILSTGYAGNLKAFLTTPSSDQPIRTVRELVDSGLPYNTVLYGESVEVALNQTRDPLLKEFWGGKEVVEYEAVPYEKVLHDDFAMQRGLAITCTHVSDEERVRAKVRDGSLELHADQDCANRLHPSERRVTGPPCSAPWPAPAHFHRMVLPPTRPLVPQVQRTAPLMLRQWTRPKVEEAGRVSMK